MLGFCEDFFMYIGARINKTLKSLQKPIFRTDKSSKKNLNTNKNTSNIYT